MIRGTQMNWTINQKLYIKIIKRFVDAIIALIALLFFIPVFLFVAPVIYLTDHGSIFYNAERIGRSGKLFKMYKFRSMQMNAPDIRLADGSTYNGADDPRVTRIGKILRSTSLDEVPQVINILKGDMSLIGPRPDPPDWLERYPDNIKPFMSVRPGITGYNQAYFRNLADGAQKMKNDLFYAQHCSFMLDLEIICKTIAVIVLRKGTYKDTSKEVEAIEQASAILEKRKGNIGVNADR